MEITFIESWKHTQGKETSVINIFNSIELRQL